MRFLIAERDDGGCFWTAIHVRGGANEGLEEVQELSAKASIDRFLDAPLNLASLGKYDVEPDFYAPGIGPGSLGD